MVSRPTRNASSVQWEETARWYFCAEAASLGTIRSRKSLVASVIFGVASALILPYVFGALAIILGTWVVYKKDKWGIIGIIIGLLVILVDYFYIVIFP